MDLAPVGELRRELVYVSLEDRTRILVLARRREVVEQFLEQFRASLRPRFYERFIGVASIARSEERFGDLSPRQDANEATEGVSTRAVAHRMRNPLGRHAPIRADAHERRRRGEPEFPGVVGRVHKFREPLAVRLAEAARAGTTPPLPSEGSARKMLQERTFAVRGI